MSPAEAAASLLIVNRRHLSRSTSAWLKQDGRDLLEHDVHPEYLELVDEILAEPAARVAFAF